MPSRFTEHFDDDLFFIHDLHYTQSKQLHLTASVDAITAPLQLANTSNSTFTDPVPPISRKRSLCNTFDSLSTFTSSSSFNFFGSNKKSNNNQKRSNSQCTLRRQRRVRNRQFKRNKTGNEESDHHSIAAETILSLEKQHTSSDFAATDPIKKTANTLSKSTTTLPPSKSTAHNSLMSWCLKQKTKFIRLRQSVF